MHRFTCQHCHRKFTWQGRGRRPRFCRASCRQQAYERRRRSWRVPIDDVILAGTRTRLAPIIEEGAAAIRQALLTRNRQIRLLKQQAQRLMQERAMLTKALKAYTPRKRISQEVEGQIETILGGDASPDEA
jgi:hypothetical protein